MEGAEVRAGASSVAGVWEARQDISSGGGEDVAMVLGQHYHGFYQSSLVHLVSMAALSCTVQSFLLSRSAIQLPFAAMR